MPPPFKMKNNIFKYNFKTKEVFGFCFVVVCILALAFIIPGFSLGYPKNLTNSHFSEDETQSSKVESAIFRSNVQNSLHPNTSRPLSSDPNPSTSEEDIEEEKHKNNLNSFLNHKGIAEIGNAENKFKYKQLLILNNLIAKTVLYKLYHSWKIHLTY